MKVTIRALLVACTCLLAFPVGAQTRADAGLVSEISKIKAIDNHAHPLKYVAAGEKADDEYDALPLEAIEAFPLPLRLSPKAERDSAQLVGKLSRQSFVRHRCVRVWSGSRLG